MLSKAADLVEVDRRTAQRQLNGRLLINNELLSYADCIVLRCWFIVSILVTVFCGPMRSADCKCFPARKRVRFMVCTSLFLMLPAALSLAPCTHAVSS